jgi:hypothetical protein
VKIAVAEATLVTARTIRDFPALDRADFRVNRRK